MTDEELNKILKKALSPEVSDVEIEIRTAERKYIMKRVVKACAAAAACLAVAVTVGVGGRYFEFNGADGVNTQESNNWFAITAYAEELTPEKEVPVVIGNRQSWCLSGDKQSGEISYDIGTAFQCEGNNIESITYSINKGAFQIVEVPGQSIVVDAKDYAGELNVGSTGGSTGENGEVVAQNRFVTEYTLSYDTQTNDTTWFSICGVENSMELINAMWPESGEFNIDAEAAAYTQLVDGVEITCTVHFDDGNSVSRIITVEGKVLSYEEAGMDFGADSSNNSGEKGAFFVFGSK